MFRKPKEEKHVYGTLRIFLRCRTVHTRVRRAAVPVGGHCPPHAARDSSDLSDMNLPGLDFRGHGLIPWGHLRPAYFTEQGASRRRLCASRHRSAGPVVRKGHGPFVCSSVDEHWVLPLSGSLSNNRNSDNGE